METYSYRRARRPSAVARGLETLLLVCVLIFSTWLFFHFTNSPIPPVDESVNFISPDAMPALESSSPPRFSHVDATTSQAADDRAMGDLIASAPSSAIPSPTPSASPTTASPVAAPDSPGAVPARAQDAASFRTSTTPSTGSAPHTPPSIQILDPRERKELEESLQRGLERFGFDPNRPDIDGVARRIAADAVVLDLAATIGLTSADVHWLARDYLSKRAAAGTAVGPARLEPAPISPRRLERTNP